MKTCVVIAKQGSRGRPRGSGRQLSAAERKRESLVRLLVSGGTRLSIALPREAVKAMTVGMKRRGLLRKSEYFRALVIEDGAME